MDQALFIGTVILVIAIVVTVGGVWYIQKKFK